MMDVRLQRQLDLVGARYRALWFRGLLTAAWLTTAFFAAAFWLIKPPEANPLPLLVLMALSCLGSAAFLAWRTARDPEWIARKIEAAFPELRTCLLAAVEQRPELPNGRFGYLQGQVIHEALTHAKRHDWPQLVSNGQIALAGFANVLAFILFAAAFTALALNLSPPLARGASSASSSIVSGPLSLTIEPGNTEVERGGSLSIVARVQGPLPATATLVLLSDAGEETRLPMSAGLNDPLFGGRIPVVDEPLKYFVELGGLTSPTYEVTVFEYPRLERADAKLKYPEYTGLEERVVQDVRTVSVVEGTRLTLQCFLNKPVTTAILTDVRNAAADPIVLAVASDPKCFETQLLCEQSRRFQLELTDDAGRKNQKPVQFSINVLPNQPPNLKPTFPAKDLEVSPLEEVDLKATVWDDFGVAKLGLTYSLAGGEPVDVVIAEKVAAKDKREAAHVVRLEELNAAPDQLLSYHWWAEDIGPDGKPRRVLGDMYFAEVRPFEEIFRQGEQPPGGEQQQRQQQQQQGQGQNAQDAQELAKLQKDIINAIWKLIRRETSDKLTTAFVPDVEQIKQSQDSALEKATGLGERVQDAKSQEHLDAVLKAMQTAANELEQAGAKPAREPLRPALSAAQAAYQSLLKLRAREHEVVRQQQQSQQGRSQQQQSSSRSQQQREQLQQLDLKNEENRYEQERTAQERRQESAADRENRQAQSRLRELARRQSDVNERLKELQSALEEASPEKQAEIRRQLKRLQDEQRQILQDTDELQSRLEEPQNAEQMSEQRQQLEETRDQVRRASEALEENKVTQAAAAGTRAEQQFEDLREEFRRRAANRFQNEMQEMRRDARNLDEEEQKIAERLKQPPPKEEGPPTLREPETDREKVAEDIAKQRQRLGELQERMKNTIGEAEDAEPILSQRLYEAVRNVQDRKVEERLQQTERAVRQGAAQQAQQQEAAAGEGLKQLREAVDRAAEGVLGDETEALRRARDELKELARDVDQEIQRNTGEGPREGQPGQASPQRGAQQPMPGQKQPGGERQPGQRQPGQQQAGERQPGGEDMNPMPNGQGRPVPGEPREGEQRGEQPGQSNRQPGEQQPGQQQSQQQPGQQQGQGQPQPGQGPGEQPQRGEQSGERGQQPGQPNQRGERQPQRLGDPQAGPGEGAGQQRMVAPLGGQDFREWSDRLRDVEEMIDDPDLRAEAARIRERARAMRVENKRHSEEPNWDLVQRQVAGPLVELQNRIAEELLRRTTKKAIVPLDRDPVPPEFSESTRRYYERLGSGK